MSKDPNTLYNTHLNTLYNIPMPKSTLIAALSPNTDDHAIHVRVGRIWQAVNKKTNMLLHTNIIYLLKFINQKA